MDVFIHSLASEPWRLRCIKLAVSFIIFALSLCGCARIPQYPHPDEFPKSSCEDFNAQESNSAVSVCRSQFHEHRFFLEGKGFVSTPETLEQTGRTIFTLLSIFAGGGDFMSAHAQNPDRWEKAADEYVRSCYGPNATILHFGKWHLNMKSNRKDDQSSYVFEVEPSDWTPPWGEWYLKREKVESIKVEELDIYLNDE